MKDLDAKRKEIYDFVETFKTIFQQKVDKFLEHCTQVAPSDTLSWLKKGFLQFLDHRCKLCFF